MYDNAIIDFENTKNIEEIIEKQKQVKYTGKLDDSVTACEVEFFDDDGDTIDVFTTPKDVLELVEEFD